MTVSAEPGEVAEKASNASGCAIVPAGKYCFSPTLQVMRFRLENGLTILLAPDERAGVFAYQSWFRAGSKHEEAGKSGVAHLLEHLMFKGTRQHPPGELDREMERRGAQTNAATWVDWTYYTEALAARGDNLETVIHFEADRMRGLCLDEQDFASERDVVRNERRQGVDDSVQGLLSEALYAAAFSLHPYRWPTIGVMAHLDALSLADVETFYRRFYVPSNATVVVGGTLEPIPTLALLARAYASMPRAERPSTTIVSEPPQRAARSVRLVRPVVTPQMVIGFHIPAQSHPHYAAVEMLGEVLVSGDNGRLYRRLVTQEGLATVVDGVVTPYVEPGLFEIQITARPGAAPEEILRLVDEELERLAQGITPWEFDKARNALELDLFEELREVEGLAETLGHFESTCGDLGLAVGRRATWRSLQSAELEAAREAVFQPHNRTDVAVVPPE